ARPDNTLSNRVLVDRTQTIAGMERHERLTGELVDRQRRCVDAERRVRWHDVANTTSSHQIDQTGRRVIRKAREAKTAKTISHQTLMRDERSRHSLIADRIEDPQIRVL